MTEEAVCIHCGEPEEGELGWFDADDGLICNRCGQSPVLP